MSQLSQVDSLDPNSLLGLGTTQACLFRDEFSPLTATGYSIFGLSSDSPKSNTTFKTKQKLPYTLLCDPNATLIAAIGMRKAPKGIVRGVFVVSKAGRVEAVEPGVSTRLFPVASRSHLRIFAGTCGYSGGCSKIGEKLRSPVGRKYWQCGRDQGHPEG